MKNKLKNIFEKIKKRLYFVIEKWYSKNEKVICNQKKQLDMKKRGDSSITVFDVANWFLSKEPMTHKKLQKLCYYAQAWYCALYDGSPLFKDEVQAWVHGPVVATLYPLYADYKWNDIPCKTFDESKLGEKERAILNAVYNTYGEFTGDQLEALTHSEDPWKFARDGFKPWEVCTKQISCESMRDYYRKKYEQEQND